MDLIIIQEKLIKKEISIIEGISNIKEGTPWLCIQDFVLKNYHLIQILNFKDIQIIINILEVNKSNLLAFIVFFGKYLDVDLTKFIKDTKVKYEIREKIIQRPGVINYIERADNSNLNSYGLNYAKFSDLKTKCIEGGAIEFLKSPINIITIN